MTLSDLALIGDAAPRATSDRLIRYAMITLSEIEVHRARSEDDFSCVARLRKQGFDRISGNEAGKKWLDRSDLSPGTFSLLASTVSGETIATMRVQDSRAGSLELTHFVPLDRILLNENYPAAQFARLSVVKHSKGPDAMFGLFKAAWRWCVTNHIQSIVIATPPWAKSIYDFMCFDDLGPEGRFVHKLAGNAEHVTMRLDVTQAEGIWRSNAQPLCTTFFDMSHPSICAD